MKKQIRGWYTGKPYDATTGLYNYGYRDYQPVNAGFITVDPIRDGNNWVAYVNNDPVNWVDPLGLSASDVQNTGFIQGLKNVGNSATEFIRENMDAINTIGLGTLQILGGKALEGLGVGGGTALAIVSGGSLTPVAIGAGAVVVAAGKALEVTGAITIAAGVMMLQTNQGGGNETANSSSQSSKDAKKLDNKGADEFSQEKGYKNAHDLKKDVLKGQKDINGGHYDVHVNNKTGEAFLIDKKGITVVPIE